MLMPVITRTTYKKASRGGGRWRGAFAGCWGQLAVSVSVPEAWCSHVVTTALLLSLRTVQGRSLYLKLGDKEVEYSDDFRLLLHTKASNPHLGPELQVCIRRSKGAGWAAV